MPRRSAVAELPPEQFEFVIHAILDNLTDREISARFKTEFGKRLAKSSLNRWRATAGNELADRFRLARFQAKQLLENVEGEDADAYQLLMRNLEDRLLTATREVITSDPIKMLRIRQEEEKRRLKERELDVRKEHLELERERLRGVQIDRVKLSEDFTADLLEYIGNDAEGLRWFKRNAKDFDGFVKNKYGAAQQ
jgi:hypothetical protein